MTDAPRSAPTDGAENQSRAFMPSVRTDRVELLGSIAADLLMADADPDALVRRAYERLADHLDVEVYVNYLIDEEEKGLRLQSCAGIDDPGVIERLQWLDFGEAVCGTVASDGRRRVMEHVQESDDPITDFVRSIGLGAYACQALVARGRIIGTLSFGTRHRDSFEREELDVMRAVSDLAAAAFDRAALLRTLDSRAMALDDLARFQSLLLNSMSQAVIATDVDGRVTAWNERAEQMYGWSASEAVGRHIFELTVPGTSQQQASEILERLAAGESWSGEFPVVRRDGVELLARVRNAPLRDDDGRHLGVIGLSEDITEERRREEETRRDQERRSEWLAFVSHELRSPLTSLIGFASRLHRRAHASEELAAVREEAELLSTEAQRMERSIDLLLRVAALDMDRVNLERQPLYLADLVAAEAKSIRARDPRVQVELRGLDEHLSLHSDEGAIRLIARNLLENAVKYGGEPPRVTLEVEVGTPGEVCMTVTDNGGGIPTDELSRIFDRYYRGDRGRTSPGLGLGLYIAHQLAGLLGGSLTAESRPGQGASFQLTLPREP